MFFYPFRRSLSRSPAAFCCFGITVRCTARLSKRLRFLLVVPFASGTFGIDWRCTDRLSPLFRFIPIIRSRLSVFAIFSVVRNFVRSYELASDTFRNVRCPAVTLRGTHAHVRHLGTRLCRLLVGRARASARRATPGRDVRLGEGACVALEYVHIPRKRFRFDKIDVVRRFCARGQRRRERAPSRSSAPCRRMRRWARFSPRHR